MLACLLAQIAAPRIAASVALSTLLGGEEAARGLSSSLRGATEVLAGLALVGSAAAAVLDAQPAAASLAATWLALGVAVIFFSRVAVDREQTLVAAFAQGAALAIYVDLRRRTPWLDDVPAVDSIVLLGLAAALLALRALPRFSARRSAVGRAAEVYAATLPLVAAAMGESEGARALVLVAGGGVYAVLARSRRLPRYEVLCGAALVVAAMLGLAHAGARAPELYLMPLAFVGTFLARRHRRAFGAPGRWLAVAAHVPLYCAAAWSALRTETFGAFALGVAVATLGVVYALRARDRRSLYAAASAALVLVVGRLVLAGLENALLGTLLLATTGVGLLAGMTVFTIRRDAAARALRDATVRLRGWDDGDEAP